MNTSDLSPGLMLVHGNQAETLRDLLVAWMREHPLAPLENEVVLVQSNGIAQWLRLALAANASEGGCGIAAAIEFSLPSRFIWRVYRAVLGRDRVPESSAFDAERLVWRLMQLLPGLLGDDLYKPLRQFLADDHDLRKRHQLAARLADLFDQYQVYRADWLAAWADGRDVLIDARGHQTPLSDDDRWQAALWRALLVPAAATDPLPGGRAGVHEAFLREAAAWRGNRPAGLPRRVLVFGISSMPQQALEVLAELARWSQVLMCVPNPCQHHWRDIIEDRDLLRARPRQTRRSGQPELLDENALHLHAHPLLAAWGKQGRDFIGLLDEYDDPTARSRHDQQLQTIGRRVDLFASNSTDTLLGQLQDDILDLRPVEESRKRWPAVEVATDRSIRFHVAHSAQREVEILHDQLLAAFEQDPTLKPRDIIVMVPDIDQYAAHIEAVFGLIPGDDPRHVPFSLADCGRRQSDPLLQALSWLLQLPRARIGVSEVLDLLDVPAVRRRFGIADDDLPLLQRWVRGANIRWGLHGEQRKDLGLPAGEDAPPHSWLFGLRRMLLGYAVGFDAEPWQGIEPYGEIGGLDAAALGPLLSLIDKLTIYWQQLREWVTPQQWGDRLRGLSRDFFDVEQDAKGYTLLELDRALQDWQDACAAAGFAERLPIDVVAEAWLAAIEQGGLSQRFLAGAVTFATLMPMRAIPFRQVYLLGMNDGDYPRARQPLGFDLMGRDYRPGDRSRREDDRYLFLEALLSARERLYISWVGYSIHDNSPRPPSVLVAQLREHLATVWQLKGQGKLLAALTTEHALQPFSPRYFPSDPQTAELFTYAAEWRAAAPASTSGPAPLEPLDEDEAPTLAQLASFIQKPVKGFFRERLQVDFEQAEIVGEDVEPFALDGLQRWQLQHELIQAQLAALAAGEPLQAVCERVLAAQKRRGELPAGGFGEHLGEALLEPMPALFARYQQMLATWPKLQGELAELDIELGGLPLHDWLPPVRANDDKALAQLIIEPSDLVKDSHYRADKLLYAWVLHLGQHLLRGPLTTVVLSKKGEVGFLPLDPEQARKHLQTLLEVRREGLRRPLPLAVGSAFAWLRSGQKEDKARVAYEGNDHNSEGERGYCPYLRRAWPDFGALTASGEFFELAKTLFEPLIAAIPKDDAKRKTSGKAPATENPDE